MTTLLDKLKSLRNYRNLMRLFVLMPFVGIGVTGLGFGYYYNTMPSSIDCGELTTNEERALRKYRNPTHLTYARKLGIQNPLQTRAAFYDKKKETLVGRDDLTHVRSNSHIYVDHMNNSHPYLTEEARQLINEIGRRCQERLKEKGLSTNYRIVVSSCLRTKEDQDSLSDGNVNAVQNSAHYYGTTFDIVYDRVATLPLWGERVISSVIGSSLAKKTLTTFSHHHNADVTKVIGRVLINLQKEKKCVALIERRFPCFHVTVR